MEMKVAAMKTCADGSLSCRITVGTEAHQSEVLFSNTSFSNRLNANKILHLHYCEETTTTPIITVELLSQTLLTDLLTMRMQHLAIYIKMQMLLSLPITSVTGLRK
jgi:hypothetical protein